jgi:hypothetical protein
MLLYAACFLTLAYIHARRDDIGLAKHRARKASDDNNKKILQAVRYMANDFGFRENERLISRLKSTSIFMAPEVNPLQLR